MRQKSPKNGGMPVLTILGRVRCLPGVAASTATVLVDGWSCPPAVLHLACEKPR
jgi:hypothetical protein